MEAVPLVGPLLGAIPAALVALSIGPSKLVWVIVATVISSSNGKLFAGAAHHAQGSRGQFHSSPAGFFCLWLFARSRRNADGDSHAAHYSLLLDRFVFHKECWSGGLARARLCQPAALEAQELAQGLRKQARSRKAAQL